MAQPQLDPRYRPFRIAVWGVYFAVLLFFAGSITFSVIRSVFDMTPDHQTATQATLSPEECLAKAKALWAELDDRRKGMSTQAEVRRVDADYWTQFRVGWLQRHREAEAACAVTSPGREHLKSVFKQLDQTMDLYTTHAVQFAGEVGPTVDALKGALGGGAP
jgi:hypothetical protein